MQGPAEGSTRAEENTLAGGHVVAEAVLSEGQLYVSERSEPSLCARKMQLVIIPYTCG